MSKVWFLTGSARGLGRAIADAVLSAGDRLVAGARNPAQLDELVECYAERVQAVTLDVTDRGAVERAVAAGVERFGRIDVAVNNAGYGNVGAFEHVTEEDFRAQIETNFFGVVNVTRAVLPIMRGQGGGHILQISSVAGRMAAPGLAAYQAAKWAVGGFSDGVAAEVAPFNIKVTVVEPGAMRTDWAGPSMSVQDIATDYAATVGVIAKLQKEYLGKEIGDPTRVAAVLRKIVEHPAPPGRLLLGSDAIAYAEQARTLREAADAEWRDISLQSDFADAAPPDYAVTNA